MNFMKLDKTYEFSVLLGVATDTDDLEGNIIETKEIQNFDENKIKKTVIGLIGEKELPVPAFSSIKVKGTRLYKIARKDRNFSNTPKKLMNIRSIEINDIRNLNKFIEVDIIAEVSSGTYIRSISKHIGQKLGLPAVVSKLERTKISEFSLADDEVNDDLDWIRENLGSTKIIVANHETTDRIGLT
jgi:tRNA pseudouridine55 synthase